ncbi:MAG: AAA family ATPase [Verrucomicrobiota bacterium]
MPSEPDALRNQTTPRVFVAATRQNDGKTTVSLGLYAALQQRFASIGYIKPVGQRFVDVEGEKIDEDTVLIKDTYRVRSRLIAMSPIAVEPNFTRDYLAHGHAEGLHSTVREAFDESSWEKDFVIIEGTGHAGVGSVFDLSNAMVAHLLQAKVVIVSEGGIGKPIDEIAMNLALYEKYGVEVVGAIFNKVLPEKTESLREVASTGLERLGLPLLGMMPYNPELRRPTLNQVCQQIGGRFLGGHRHKRVRVAKVTIGAMSYRNVENYFEPGTLIITAGDRESLILTVLGEKRSKKLPIAGVVLTSDMLPSAEIIEIIEQRNIPFIATSLSAYKVAAAINKMTVKTEVGDLQKISLIQDLVTNHVDLDGLLRRVMPANEPAQMPLW